MNGCNYIKGLIDEADKPDLLSFEVNEHIGRCADCERFASERAGLRKLVASSARVNAPINFDAMLNARLLELRARGSFSWLSPAGYLRLGAATAGLVIMIFAAQYSGLLSKPDRRATVAPPTNVAAKPPATADLVSHKSQESIGDRIVAAASRAGRAPRKEGFVGRRITPGGYSTAEEGGVVLVRGQNGEMDVPLPRVSVGAQPLLYVSAGQRAARNVGTSF